MAIGASSVWEVRTGGSANNGGGFDSTISGAGTDYTQQNTAQQNWDGVTNILSTVGVNSTTVISNTAVFTSAMVGNALHITAGTNFTAGFYFITAFTSTTQVVVDRTPAATAGSLGTGNVGGALALPSQVTAVMVAGNTMWVKSGTYSVTTTATIPAGSVGNEIIIAGYNSTHGDLDSVTDFSNFPNIVVNNAAVSCFTQSSDFSSVRNFVGDAGSGGTKGNRFINSSGNNANSIINCKATGAFTVSGFTVSGNTLVRNCLATGIGATGFLVTGSGGIVINCVATACTGVGFLNNQTITITFIRCISYSNTGGTSHGFSHSGNGTGDDYINCIAYNNGGDGFHFSAASSVNNTRMLNCIAANNAGWGVNSATTTWNALPQVDYTAYYSNTSGTTTGIPLGLHDIVLAADPFTNSSGGNFTLNGNNPGGFQLQNTGNTSIFPGLTPTSYLDFGSYQHQGLQTAFVLNE